MHFSKIVTSVIKQLTAKENGHETAVFLTGTPGGGKSACVREIARQLMEKYKIPEERVVEFNPSLRDPVDILGIPFKARDGKHSEWLPPSEFYAIRSGQGASILILEELSDAGINMQNPLCRVILDRYAGQLKLSEKLFILATGNRVEDKSGANRMSTKLGNRLLNLEFSFSLDDWVDWALGQGISPNLIGFIKFRPELLSKFDPKQTINPTPRSWEMVSRVPESLGAAEYFEFIRGCVGDGPASEYTGFLKVAQKMPDPEKIIKEPDKTAVPTEPSVLYAVSSALETLFTDKNADSIFKYVMRMPPEFCAKFMAGVYRRDKSILNHERFREWAVKNGQLLNGMS